MPNYEYYKDKFLSEQLLMITFVNPDNALPPYGKELLLEVLTKTGTQYLTNGTYEDDTWYVKYGGVKASLYSDEIITGWRMIAV